MNSSFTEGGFFQQKEHNQENIMQSITYTELLNTHFVEKNPLGYLLVNLNIDFCDHNQVGPLQGHTS